MNKVTFYKDHRNNDPVTKFILTLSPKDRAKVFRSLELLEEFGVNLKLPHARQIQGKLWELRPGSNRLLYFAHIDNQFVILHAFKKKTQKTPPQEIKKALSRMKEYL